MLREVVVMLLVDASDITAVSVLLLQVSTVLVVASTTVPLLAIIFLYAPSSHCTSGAHSAASVGCNMSSIWAAGTAIVASLVTLSD